MKIKTSLLAAALLAAQSFAGESLTLNPAVVEQADSFKHFSGSLTIAAETNYVGRGLVATHAAEEGDGTETIALQTKYRVAEDSPWSIENTIAYKILSEGHTLYGAPEFGPMHQQAGYRGVIKECNMENEFAFVTAARYTQPKWNVVGGHRFVHGGILGVMAKHYREQGASVVNEAFVTPEWTPAPWVAVGCTVSYSFQGITGWWIEPYATFKAPLIREGEETKLAAVCTFGMSATHNYFDPDYVACANGAQAFWIKLSTPWFATEDLIITPSVSFNWAGPGALKANRVSEFRTYSENDTYIPFRDFAVVGGISATLRF